MVRTVRGDLDVEEYRNIITYSTFYESFGWKPG